MGFGECGRLRPAHLLYESSGAGYEPAINVADTLYSGGFLGGVDYYSEHHFQSREAVTYTREATSIKIGAEFEPIWFYAQTPYFTPGVGIFSPQSFFGAGPFSAPFGPGTAVEFLFQQTRADFGNQVPQRALPSENGFYDGPDGPAHQAADEVAFWHKLGGFYVQDQWRARPNLALSFGLRYDLDFLPSANDLQNHRQDESDQLRKRATARRTGLRLSRGQRGRALQLRYVYRIVGIQQSGQRMARRGPIHNDESATAVPIRQPVSRI